MEQKQPSIFADIVFIIFWSVAWLAFLASIGRDIYHFLKTGLFQPNTLSHWMGERPLSPSSYKGLDIISDWIYSDLWLTAVLFVLAMMLQPVVSSR